MKALPVFIGYDGDAEPIAYHVCADSIIRHSSIPVAIVPLALSTLRKVYKETHTDGSNQFIYSRFLVPYLMNFEGRAVFLDGDMIVRDDIAKLLAEHEANGPVAVSVVKHKYATKFPVKYLGAKNEDYPRKNWSSVMVFECAHPAHWELTPQNVAQATGAYLHRFQWLLDDEIGALPETWNRLVMEQELTSEDKLLHYTVGTPCFADYSRCEGSEEWHRAAAKAFGHTEKVAVFNRD